MLDERIYASVKEDEELPGKMALSLRSLQIIEGFRCILKTGLASCTVTVPSLYWRNSQYNVDDETAADTRGRKRFGRQNPSGKELALALTKAFKDRLADSVSFQQPDENGGFTATDWDDTAAELYQPSGTILIPWTHLFIWPGRSF